MIQKTRRGLFAAFAALTGGAIMSYRGDDLTPLLLAAPTPGVGFRQGVVLTWNPATAENTIDVAGAILTNVPILNTAEALLLAPGAVVGIMTAGPSWFIVGRITVPGTPEAVQTFGAGMQVAFVSSNTSITSTTMQLNGGPSVTTQILSTGRAFVQYASGMNLDIGEGVGLGVIGAGPGGEIAGTQGGLDGRNEITTDTGNLGGTITVSCANGELITGMTPGSWTFELRSQKTAGTAPAVYSRVLSVMPF